ncbi:MAG: S-adenosylmethionine-binding protein [Armatimonadetes bacterium]|nr:S-adenosylmethionine-binding protein [Armatimonadota bacterium]
MSLREASRKEVESAFAQVVAQDLLDFAPEAFGTIYADPPWRFQNRTGKMAPEHRRLRRYPTMSFDEIGELPVARIARPTSHLYLWVPNALIAEALEVMKRWGFTYKTNLIWYKVRKDGGPDRRGVGFYFRNVTEVCLFGVRGKNVRTNQPGRTMPNIILAQKTVHSRKPEEMYDVIEQCSNGPFLELFSRTQREGWTMWGHEAGLFESDFSAVGSTPKVEELQPKLLERKSRYNRK